MQYGQQDASETYDIFMKLLKYEPFSITTQKEYKTPDGITKISKPEKQDISYITIENDGKDNYSIVDNIFRGKWEDLGPNTENWVRCDKTNKQTYRFMKSSVTKMNGNCVVMVINRGNKFTGKYINEVNIPDYIDIGNTKYFRFAVISHVGSLHIHSGHYITILWDNEEYYIFDDMNPGEISQYKLSYSQQRQITRKTGVMLFYFPVK